MEQLNSSDDSNEPDDGPIQVEDIANMMSDLRAIAYNLVRDEQDGCSVRPTALIVSGLKRYKVSDQEWEEVSWENRSHFFKCAYIMMKRSLIDRARKRGARPQLNYTDPLDLYNIPEALEATPDRIIALDEALALLEESDPNLATIVQHHYFSRLTVGEIARIVDRSERTVKRELSRARVQLEKTIRALESKEPPVPD